MPFFPRGRPLHRGGSLLPRHRAQEIGYDREVVLAGRSINDGMGAYGADQLARPIMKMGFPVGGSRILAMGLAFKENCLDLRNSKGTDGIGKPGAVIFGVKAMFDKSRSDRRPMGGHR